MSEYPYYVVDVSIELDSVQPGAVGEHGFPTDMGPWDLVNKVLEQTAGKPSGAAGTGFGCRDLTWYFEGNEENPHDHSVEVYRNLKMAIHTLGWHGFLWRRCFTGPATAEELNDITFPLGEEA